MLGKEKKNINSGEHTEIVKETIQTPRLVLNRGNGSIGIKGIILYENVLTFQDQLLNWLVELTNQNNNAIVFNIALEYINTPGSKVLWNISKELINFHKQNKQVIINWYYDKEDDDMYDVGKDYQKHIEFAKFVFIPVDSIYDVNIDSIS